MSTSTLAGSQRALASALTMPGDDLPEPLLAAIVPGGTLDAAGALGVYRRGYIARLTEQLGETWPSVWRVVGDDDFFELCRAFIARHASSSYNLSDYGREFPRFLETRPSLPEFLPELARFELVVHDLFHATAHLPVEAAELAAIGDLAGTRFRFGAGVRLVACEHAVYDVFLHRNDVEPPDLDLDRAQHVLLFRDGGDVRARVVGAATFAALEALAEGLPVEDAIERATSCDESFGAAEVSSLFEIVALCGLVEAVVR
jgi:hypothetical protein